MGLKMKQNRYHLQNSLPILNYQYQMYFIYQILLQFKLNIPQQVRNNAIQKKFPLSSFNTRALTTHYKRLIYRVKNIYTLQTTEVKQALRPFD
jgi:hypothetical protein